MAMRKSDPAPPLRENPTEKARLTIVLVDDARRDEVIVYVSRKPRIYSRFKHRHILRRMPS
jgi:hypothetical protein